MITSVITLLITLLVIAALIYLVLWVFGTALELPLPAKVIQIMWVIFALVALLLIVQLVLSMPGMHLGFR